MESLAAYLKQQEIINYEVIVVAADGGDDTAAIAKTFTNHFEELRVLEPGAKVGKGRDVAYGMQAAAGNLQIFMDADLATPLHHLPAMIEKLQSASVVVGVRDLAHIHTGMRKIISIGWNLLARVLLGIQVSDTQCGFKGFTKDASKICFGKLTIKGWLFDMEVLAIANVNTLTIDSIPIPDWTDVPDGTFSSSIIKDSVMTLREFSKIWWQKVKGYYRWTA